MEKVSIAPAETDALGLIRIESHLVGEGLGGSRDNLYHQHRLKAPAHYELLQDMGVASIEAEEAVASTLF